MDQFEPLAVAGEDDVVVANRIAAAQRRKADIAFAARAGNAVAGALRHLFEDDAAAEGERRPRRGVDLAAVMHLEDLDVPIGPEPTRHLLDDDQQHVHAKAHIRRPYERYGARGAAYRFALLGRQAGRADHHRFADGGGERGMRGGRFGRGEFDDDIAVAHQLFDVLADRDADPPDTGELADILIDVAAAGRFAAAGDGATRGRGDLGDQPPAHAAAAADAPQLNPSHPRLRLSTAERLPIGGEKTSRAERRRR